MWNKKNKKIDDIEVIFNTKSKANFDDLLEKPLGKNVFYSYIFFIFLVLGIFSWKLFDMQIIQGDYYQKEAKKNFIKSEVIFSDRGIVTDRNGVELIWNKKSINNSDFSEREYVKNIGLSHILGFLTYPKKDSSGNYFVKEYRGKAGVEKYYNNYLNGKLGKRIIKLNSHHKAISKNSLIQPEAGKNLKLTIDARLQKTLAEVLKKYMTEDNFTGVSGAIMNIKTGEILASVSLPEYDSNIMTEAKNKKQIREYLNDKRNIFLNRTFLGGYTPGSTIKPFVGINALENKIIKPYEKIHTYGKLIMPNKWNPSKPTIFSDWKNHGTVDLFKAITWSSNVYFYILGGGLHNIKDYRDRQGLGIKRLEKGYHDFGFGEKTEIERFKEKSGLVPNPEWKEKVFKTKWNVGNTYFTSIGQFGFLVSPIQLLVGVSALANNGKVLRPVISELGKKENIKRELNYSPENFKYIQKAMRETVLSGTTQSLNLDYIKVATKSGTAQVKNNTKNNAWVEGFWPYNNPKYAFVILGDEGPIEHRSASIPMRWFFDSLKEQGITEYFK